MRRLTEWLCGLSGHETVRQFDDGRLSLRCIACGYETPGWDLKSDVHPQPRAREKEWIPIRILR